MDTAGIRGERLSALLETVDAVLHALKDAAHAEGSAGRARARVACAKALGQLAWLTEILRSVKEELEEPIERRAGVRRETSHSLSIH